MNADRIERALREGPLDEPTYMPGRFRRAGNARLTVAIAAWVGVALVAGFAIGVGLDAFRGNVGGEAEPRPLVAADILGVWRSEEIELRDWVQALLDEGFDQPAVDAFLEHDPFEDNVRYALRFVDNRLIIQAAFDNLPFQTLTEGRYVVLDDSAVHVVEVVDTVEGCEVAAAAAIDREQLRTRVLNFLNCDAEERMAMTIFFDLATYERAE